METLLLPRDIEVKINKGLHTHSIFGNKVNALINEQEKSN